MVDIRDLSDEELARFTRTRRDEYELVRNTARFVLHERYGGLMEELENDRPRRRRLDTEGLRKQIEKEIGARIERTDTLPDNGPLNLDYRDLSDEELLWQYGTKGDDDAFTELFERHRMKFLHRWRALDEAFFGHHGEELTDCVRVAFQGAANAFADSREGCMPCVKGLVGASFRGFVEGLEDGELVLLCRMRDSAADLNSPEARQILEDAWNVLHERYRGMAVRSMGEPTDQGTLANQLLRTARTPEGIYDEAIQNVLKPNAYDPEGGRSFGSYLLWQMKHRAFDALRRRRLVVDGDYEAIPPKLPQQQWLQGLLLEEHREMLAEALAREPDECRALLDMRLYSCPKETYDNNMRELMSLGYNRRSVNGLMNLASRNWKRMVAYVQEQYEPP